LSEVSSDCAAFFVTLAAVGVGVAAGVGVAVLLVVEIAMPESLRARME